MGVQLYVKRTRTARKQQKKLRAEASSGSDGKRQHTAAVQMAAASAVQTAAEEPMATAQVDDRYAHCYGCGREWKAPEPKDGICDNDRCTNYKQGVRDGRLPEAQSSSDPFFDNQDTREEGDDEGEGEWTKV